MKDLSVIIPTYNRKELLKKTLVSLDNQTYPKKNYEVIVIDDGSTDGTEGMIKSLKKGLKIGFKYFKQTNKGPAAARNIGIKKSKGEYIFFIDDDIEASPNLLEEHMKVHKSRQDIAVLGYTAWAEDIEVTPFMWFVAPNGVLFNYEGIKNPNDCGYKVFWSNNISLHRKWLKDDTFDETFYPSKGNPIMEDVELAYRLHKKGLKLVLNKKALAYHHHKIEAEKFFNRAKLAGQVEILFYKKHGFKEKIEKYKKITGYVCLINNLLFILSPVLKIINKKKYWGFRMIKSRFEGIREGLTLYT